MVSKMSVGQFLTKFAAACEQNKLSKKEATFSWVPSEHKAEILALAEKLKQCGITAQIDAIYPQAEVFGETDKINFQKLTELISSL